MGRIGIKRIGLFAALMALAGCLALVGCSSSASSSSSASESSSSSSAEPDMLVLGQETDTAVNVVFANEIGSDITNFAVLPAGSTDAPQFLMNDGDSFKGGEKAKVFVEPAGDSLFDAVVMCGDKQYTLHDLNFQKMEEATIRLEGEVAYIETVLDGNVVSSLREEVARAEAAAAAAKPAPEPEPEQPAQQEVYYEQPAADAAPAQTEDTCVSDVVLR